MFKSNYFKLFMKFNKVNFGKNLNLYGTPIIFKKKRSKLNIGENCTIRSSFLSNLVGLSQRTIIVTRTEEANINIGNNVGISELLYTLEKE
ncbi:putative acetyltransferase [[Clostridium] sordellii ATCC 9714]|nr:putative acetyltransferase [[Clostridium] sordellii ATCC 9714] [Paeniclostridium sordellii ATCC 9714]